MTTRPSGGRLTVVGTGIRFAGQLTIEGRAAIQQADKVLFLVADAATFAWLLRLTQTAEPESLHVFYDTEKDRRTTYFEMVERILLFVRQGRKVCCVTYGHPGVFALPFHEAIRRARAEGYPARMLPGVSAEDNLFADLGLDPGMYGCQSFEATDFLVHHRPIDPTTSLILWQIAVIGQLGYREPWRREDALPGLTVLTEVLSAVYGPEHEVIVYEAAQFPICEPVIERVRLLRLPETAISPLSTLYVPPKTAAIPDPAMLHRLGMPGI